MLYPISEYLKSIFKILNRRDPLEKKLIYFRINYSNPMLIKLCI